MKVLINSLVFLLIFLTSLFITVNATYPYDIDGFSHGVRLFVLFVLALIMAVGYLKLFGHRLPSNTIIIAILLPIIAVAISFTFVISLTFTIKISPVYVSMILGLIAGSSIYQSGFKIKKLLLFSLFPLIMAFGVYDLWMHRIEYGNFDGVVKNIELAQFEFTNKENGLVSSEDLKGKVVWLDFWFVGCPPCWKAFPEVQEVYEKYKDNPSFALYVVNRDDDPDILFSKIEEKGYTFPVLKGTQQKINSLGVYFFPTVMLLNKKGEIVFIGELPDAKIMLQKLLND